VISETFSTASTENQERRPSMYDHINWLSVGRSNADRHIGVFERRDRRLWCGADFPSGGKRGENVAPRTSEGRGVRSWYIQVQY
jgi:hypothetical protein